MKEKKQISQQQLEDTNREKNIMGKKRRFRQTVRLEMLNFS